jgi:hypothetical protein
MAIEDFADVAHKHDEFHKKVSRNRRLMLPLRTLLRAIFSVSRLFGFEYQLFCRLLKPVRKAFGEAMENAFADYNPTEHDVFVCSYMKSGTNWMMQVVHQIAHRGEGDFDEILHVVAWPDCPSQEITIGLSDPRTVKFSPTGLRAIKTHAAADLVPYNDEAKYVCVVRDPKDVVVSAYHFIESIMLGPLMPSVETWVKYMKNPGFGYWADLADSYWRWRDRPNVLFITYEEMNDDTTGAIKRIATLMGVDLTEQELAKVVELSSFAYMKSVDHKFYPGEMGPFADGGGSMVRSGKNRSSGEMLSVVQQRMIDDYSRERLRELGSDFPYEQHYGGKTHEP